MNKIQLKTTKIKKNGSNDLMCIIKDVARSDNFTVFSHFHLSHQHHLYPQHTCVFREKALKSYCTLWQTDKLVNIVEALVAKEILLSKSGEDHNRAERSEIRLKFITWTEMRLQMSANVAL